MPALRPLRPFTMRLVNPITRLFAGYVPGFAIVISVGRRSGRTYRTPLNIFRRGSDYVLALTYGADVQWVKNVVAAGGCILQVRGRSVPVGEPQVVRDPRQRLIPIPVRWFLRLLRVDEFLILRPL